MTAIRFHIGAHKTATTHLQLTLAHCRLAPGTRYVPLGWLRRTLTSPVRHGRPHLPWQRWYGGTWLFSDENILGTTAQGLKLYPDPARALRHFADTGLSVFLCVRRYDEFLVSAWGERLWHHGFEPFAAELPARRWTDLVRDLRRDLRGVPVHVWRYEDYRIHAQSIAQHYAGGAIEAFGAPLAQDPKSGFSARAVQELADRGSRRVGKRELLALRAAHPVRTASERYDPWSAAQKDALAAMYDEDLASLRRMAELWLPPAAPGQGEATSPASR
ncbi:MAG: hypothetical protein HYZ20_06670 [Burkholderiales bacterium]|nr:hypothetical protein [Burkholderiales bacterium]